MLDVPAAEIRIVFLNARRDIVERQPVLLQLGGIDADLELLRLTTPGIDFADSLHCAELVPDRPLLNIFELHSAQRTTDCVLVKFSEGRCGGTENGLDAFG